MEGDEVCHFVLRKLESAEDVRVFLMDNNDKED